MKKLLLTIPLFIIFSCGQSNVNTEETKIYVGEFFEPIKIIEIDGCEYIFGDWGYSTILTHKGNCKNDIHKLKSE
jgi:hypothetical protein